MSKRYEPLTAVTNLSAVEAPLWTEKMTYFLRLWKVLRFAAIHACTTFESFHKKNFRKRKNENFSFFDVTGKNDVRE